MAEGVHGTMTGILDICQLMAKHGQAAARIKKGNPGGAEILVYHTGRKEAESLGNPKGGKKKVQGRGVGTR